MVSDIHSIVAQAAQPNGVARSPGMVSTPEKVCGGGSPEQFCFGERQTTLPFMEHLLEYLSGDKSVMSFPLWDQAEELFRALQSMPPDDPSEEIIRQLKEYLDLFNSRIPSAGTPRGSGQQDLLDGGAIRTVVSFLSHAEEIRSLLETLQGSSIVQEESRSLLPLIEKMLLFLDGVTNMTRGTESVAWARACVIPLPLPATYETVLSAIIVISRENPLLTSEEEQNLRLRLRIETVSLGVLLFDFIVQGARISGSLQAQDAGTVRQCWSQRGSLAQRLKDKDFSLTGFRCLQTSSGACGPCVEVQG